MCATSISPSISRPPERRRNLRLRVSSLIYAQLGSDNGGVVVNLGPDGILFQAAHKLNAHQNSTITLKLRGSGLNTEIAGEIVWVGATHKAAGIAFKSLPANVKQSLADWVAREAVPPEVDRPTQRAPQKAISEIADMVVRERRTLTRSLSAALARSQAASADDAAAVLENGSDSHRDGATESSPLILPPAPSLESIPGAEDPRRAAADAPVDDFEYDDVLDIHPLVENRADEILGGGPIEKQELSDGPPAPELPPSSVLKPSFVHPSKEQEIVLPPKNLEKPATVPPRAAAEMKPPEKIQKIIPRASAASSPAYSVRKRPTAWQVIEQWIPREAHAAWKRLSLKHRQLLAHTGTICLGLTIGLLSILLLTHIHVPSGRAVKSATPQQLATAAESPAEKSGSANEPRQQGAATMAGAQAVNPAQPSAPSLFSKIMSGIFGDKPDGSPKINDYQLGLAVWTSQSSGYYYCSDDPYAKSVQPGVPMLQGDALQAGYRPRLGQFCN